MKKIVSTRYSAGAFNTAMLILRLALGILIAHHGYQKLVNFNEMKGSFMNLMGIGSTTSLMLVIFAEFFCGILIVLGLFTRFAAIPLIITMCVVIFITFKHDFFGKAELPTVYLAGFIALLLCGPGKASVDGMIGK